MLKTIVKTLNEDQSRGLEPSQRRLASCMKVPGLLRPHVVAAVTGLALVSGAQVAEVVGHR